MSSSIIAWLQTVIESSSQMVWTLDQLTATCLWQQSFQKEAFYFSWIGCSKLEAHAEQMLSNKVTLIVLLAPPPPTNSENRQVWGPWMPRAAKTDSTHLDAVERAGGSWLLVCDRHGSDDSVTAWRLLPWQPHKTSTVQARKIFHFLITEPPSFLFLFF